jgi:hypothetical protein
MSDTNQAGGTTTRQLVLAWGFVGIPLALGVLQTLINAMKLFQGRMFCSCRFLATAASWRLASADEHARGKRARQKSARFVAS